MIKYIEDLREIIDLKYLIYLGSFFSIFLILERFFKIANTLFKNGFSVINIKTEKTSYKIINSILAILQFALGICSILVIVYIIVFIITVLEKGDFIKL